MSKITNIEELHAEILRLRKSEQEQHEKIKLQLKEIREELKPSNLFMGFVSSVLGVRMEKNEFLKEGIAYGISLLLQRVVLKGEKKFEKKIYEWVDTLFDRIRHFINRFTDPAARRDERREEEPFIPGE